MLLRSIPCLKEVKAIFSTQCTDLLLRHVIVEVGQDVCQSHGHLPLLVPQDVSEVCQEDHNLLVQDGGHVPVHSPGLSRMIYHPQRHRSHLRSKYLYLEIIINHTNLKSKASLLHDTIQLHNLLVVAVAVVVADDVKTILSDVLRYAGSHFVDCFTREGAGELGGFCDFYSMVRVPLFRQFFQLTVTTYF